MIKIKSKIILLPLRKNGALERHITWVWEKMKLWLFGEPILSWQYLGIKPTIAEFSVSIWAAGSLPIPHPMLLPFSLCFASLILCPAHAGFCAAWSQVWSDHLWPGGRSLRSWSQASLPEVGQVTCSGGGTAVMWRQLPQNGKDVWNVGVWDPWENSFSPFFLFSLESHESAFIPRPSPNSFPSLSALLVACLHSLYTILS